MVKMTQVSVFVSPHKMSLIKVKLEIICMENPDCNETASAAFKQWLKDCNETFIKLQTPRRRVSGPYYSATFIFTSSSPFPHFISSPSLFLLWLTPSPRQINFPLFLPILLRLPGHAFSFVSRSHLHFQQTHIISASCCLPSRRSHPSPHPHSFQGVQSIDSPLSSDYHASHSQGGVCLK